MPVLSLIRSEPRKAERALEDLAELFRVLMAENNQMSTLWRELELARNYLALEELRLGERLKIDWHTDTHRCRPASSADPAAAAGKMVSRHRAASGSRHDQRQHLPQPQRIAYRHPQSVSATSGESQHNGNKMAMANIRERLALFLTPKPA